MASYIPISVACGDLNPIFLRLRRAFVYHFLANARLGPAGYLRSQRDDIRLQGHYDLLPSIIQGGGWETVTVAVAQNYNILKRLGKKEKNIFILKCGRKKASKGGGAFDQLVMLLMNRDEHKRDT